MIANTVIISTIAGMSEPKDILSEFWREDNKDNTYVTLINFVLSLKSSAPFHEHSPQLYSLTSLESWGKVKGGMFKLWKGEVVDKFVVVQHLVFGEEFRCTWVVEESFRGEGDFVGEKFINREGGEMEGSVFPGARGGGGLPEPGRAPWANNGGGGGGQMGPGGMPVTRAPWAGGGEGGRWDREGCRLRDRRGRIMIVM